MSSESKPMDVIDYLKMSATCLAAILLSDLVRSKNSELGDEG